VSANCNEKLGGRHAIESWQEEFGRSNDQKGQVRVAKQNWTEESVKFDEEQNWIERKKKSRNGMDRVSGRVWTVDSREREREREEMATTRSKEDEAN
jgi:hypothetical protein